VVEAGIDHVVAAVRDPNPLVDGGGFRLLEASGVPVTTGVLEAEASDLIAGFGRHMRTGLPLVTLKMAASLDGKTAARDGSSRWITGDEARKDVHRLRAAAGAIAVGAATVASDDPSLTVRLYGYRGRAPIRVVVDGRGRLPASAKVFDDSAPTLVVTTPIAPQQIRDGWEAAGAEVLVLEPSPGGQVPLALLVEALGKRDVQDLLIEGGSTLAWSAVESGLVDRLVLYIAPKLIGGVDAPGLLGGDGVGSVMDALPVSIRSIEPIGDDVKVVADVHRDR
jgi:diaminohydroxyphosphoribosylaminopyrimidine deaminase/5-amino-6-(5-phosphoribosylamino)uracil reductase